MPGRFVIGLGPHLGISEADIEAAVVAALSRYGLDLGACRNLAVLDRRRAEQGLRAFAEHHELRIEFFSSEQLDAVRSVPNPSPLVEALSGIWSVAEAAALLSAGSGRLLVEKQKFPNVTVAVAEVPEG